MYAKMKKNTAEQNNKHLYEQFRFPWTAGWIEDEPEGIFWYAFLCAHPTITIREHLLDRHGSKKNIPGEKIIISIGCLHSFQGLLYIVLALEGYFVVTGATWDLCWDIRAHRHNLFFFTRSWQKPRLALNALFTWPEKASRKRQVLETLEQFHPIPMNKKNPANNLLWCLKLQVGSGVNHVPPKCLKYSLLLVSSVLPVL